MEGLTKKCRYCGREIVLVQTEGGRRIPCDPALIPFWWEGLGDEVFVTRDGELVPGSRGGDPEELTDVGYIPHHCERR